jgi:Zn-dependent protease
MLRRNLRLFTLRGIPVEVNATWLLVLALVTWSFATGFYPDSYPGLFTTGTLWALALATAMLLFISILLHELGHSIVASRGGLPIRRITLFMFGGVAQMGHEADDPSLELRMAAAGPAITLILAAVFYAASRLTGGMPTLSVLFGTVSAVNVGVLIFNLVPGFPLDGGRMLRAAIWKRSGDVIRATRIATVVGRVFAWLLIALGAFSFAVSGNIVSGIWMVMIGLFLRQVALSSYRIAVWKSSIDHLLVRDVMRTEIEAVEPSTDLKRLVEEVFLRLHLDCAAVADNGVLIGLVQLDDVMSVNREAWPEVTAGEIAGAGGSLYVAGEEDPAWTLFGPLVQRGMSMVPVTGPDGRLSGMVTGKDYSELLRVMSSIGRR